MRLQGPVPRVRGTPPPLPEAALLALRPEAAGQVVVGETTEQRPPQPVSPGRCRSPRGVHRTLPARAWHPGYWDNDWERRRRRQIAHRSESPRGDAPVPAGHRKQSTGGQIGLRAVCRESNDVAAVTRWVKVPSGRLSTTAVASEVHDMVTRTQDARWRRAATLSSRARTPRHVLVDATNDLYPAVRRRSAPHPR